jgi:hypothetical protein
MTQEQTDELNRIAQLIEDEKQHQCIVRKMRDELNKLRSEGSGVHVFVITCHTIAREWGEHFFQAEKAYFTFDDALKALNAIKDERSNTGIISVDSENSTAEWDFEGYDGKEHYEINPVPLEIQYSIERKFKVGDIIRKKNRGKFDKDMEVKRIAKDYYFCDHIGQFSGEPIYFTEEDNYELLNHEK